MSDFDPFADDGAVIEVGGLTIENGFDGIALFGELAIKRDKESLKIARSLKAILDATVEALATATDLPDVSSPIAPLIEAKNPLLG